MKYISCYFPSRHPPVPIEHQNRQFYSLFKILFLSSFYPFGYDCNELLQRCAITCFLFHKLNVCLKMCDCVVAAMRALPPAMTDHLSHHQHFFTWRHQHTLAHFSNYTLTFPLTPSRLSDQNNFQRLTLHLPHIIFTTSFNSTDPEKNKSSRFYPQPPLSSVHFIITWRFNPTVSRAD